MARAHWETCRKRRCGHPECRAYAAGHGAGVGDKQQAVEAAYAQGCADTMQAVQMQLAAQQ